MDFAIHGGGTERVYLPVPNMGIQSAEVKIPTKVENLRGLTMDEVTTLDSKVHSQLVQSSMKKCSIKKSLNPSCPPRSQYLHSRL